MVHLDYFKLVLVLASPFYVHRRGVFFLGHYVSHDVALTQFRTSFLEEFVALVCPFTELGVLIKLCVGRTADNGHGSGWADGFSKLNGKIERAVVGIDVSIELPMVRGVVFPEVLVKPVGVSELVGELDSVFVDEGDVSFEFVIVLPVQSQVCYILVQLSRQLRFYFLSSFFNVFVFLEDSLLESFLPL